MCGIVGYIQTATTTIEDDNRHRYALMELLFMDSLRGLDSTGIAVIPKYQDAEHKPFVFKKAVPGYVFIDLAEYKPVLQAQSKPGIFLGHNRAATRGEVSDYNAHPFVADHITLVHNGSINNMLSLDSGIQSTVDSKHIAHAIAKHGAEAVLPKIDGPAILVWHNATENSMNIARTKDRELRWIFDKNGTCWFASEREMLWSALKRNNIEPVGEFLTIPEYHHYKWELADAVTETPGKLTKTKFEFSPPWRQKNKDWNKSTEGSNTGKACTVTELRPNKKSPITCTSDTAIATDTIKRHEPLSKRKIDAVDRKLQVYGLSVGDEITICRTQWHPDKAKEGFGDVIGTWDPKKDGAPLIKVILPDVPRSLWDRQDSRHYTVVVYNVIQEHISSIGKHQPVLYAKVKAYRLTELVQGPGGKLITPTAFEDEARYGCMWCADTVSIANHEITEWVNGKPLCRKCSINFAHNMEAFLS
jgi:hypothetical protein